MPISSPLFVNVCTACVCMLLRVSVCVYTVLCVSLYSSPLQKAPVQIITSPACPSYCPTNARLCVSLHTQIVCKWPRAVCVSTCRVFTATPQANLSADGDLLSGFIGSFTLQRARSLSLYVNSSAFCPTPL